MRIAVVIAALLPLPALAVTWSCGLTPAATQIACLAQDEAEPEAPAAETPPVTVRGTRFPLDPRRAWFVDLWSPATDAEGVERLARATMCYRSTNCTVVWRNKP